MIEEKKQKKIKASGTPAKLAWYQAKFPAPEGAVGDACQVGLVLQDLRDAGQVDYRTILATISLSSVRKAAAS